MVGLIVCVLLFVCKCQFCDRIHPLSNDDDDDDETNQTIDTFCVCVSAFVYISIIDH